MDGKHSLTEQIIGAAIDVHRAVGPGFQEQVYQRGMSIALSKRSIQHACEYPIRVEYEGHVIGEGRVDILVDQLVVTELKAVDEIHPVHKAQTLAYLRALKLKYGLLINFNTPVLKQGIRRIANPDVTE